MPGNEEISDWFENVLAVAEGVGSVHAVRSLLSQYQPTHESITAEDDTHAIARPNFSRAFRLEVFTALLPKIRNATQPSQPARSFLESAGPLLAEMSQDVGALEQLLAEQPTTSSNPVHDLVHQSQRALHDVLKTHKSLLAELGENQEQTRVDTHWNQFLGAINVLNSLLSLLPQQFQESELIQVSQSILDTVSQLLQPGLDFSRQMDDERVNLAHLMAARVELADRHNAALDDQDDLRQQLSDNNKAIVLQQTKMDALSDEKAILKANFANELNAFHSQSHAWVDLLRLGHQEELSIGMEQSSDASKAIVSHLGTLVGLEPPTLTEQPIEDQMLQAFTIGSVALPFVEGAMGKLGVGVGALSTMGPMVPALGLGLAAVGLVTYVSGQRHERTQQMVQQNAVALSKQIHQVSEFMDGRFNRIETILDVSTQHMDRRFRELEGIVTVGVTHLDKRLTQLQQLMVAACRHSDQRFDRLESILDIYHQYTDSRFERIEALQGLSLEYQALRFDSLENLLQGLDRQMISRFRYLETKMVGMQREAFRQLVSLSDSTDRLLQDMSTVQQRFNRFASDMEERLRVLYQQSYLTERTRFYGYLRYGVVSDQRMFIDFVNTFKRVATREAKTSVLTGGEVANFNELAHTLRHSEGRVEYQVRSMTCFVNEVNEPLVNPLIWADASRTLIDLILRSPDIEVRSALMDDLDAVVHEGQKFRQAIITMKKNTLLPTLLKNYHVAVKGVIEAARAKLLFINYPEAIQQETLFATLKLCSDMLQQEGAIQVSSLWKQHVSDIRKFMLKQHCQQIASKLSGVQQAFEVVLNLSDDENDANTSLEQVERMMSVIQAPASDPVHAFYQTHLGEDFVKHVHQSLSHDFSRPGSLWHQRIMALDNATCVLKAYLSLLFRSTWMHENPTLRLLCEKHLWEKSRLEQYFHDPHKVTQLIHFPLQGAMIEVKPLTTWIEKHRVLAEHQEQQGNLDEAAGYPLVTSVLKQLKQCRSLAKGLLNEQNLQQPSSCGQAHHSNRHSTSAGSHAYTPPPILITTTATTSVPGLSNSSVTIPSTVTTDNAQPSPKLPL